MATPRNVEMYSALSDYIENHVLADEFRSHFITFCKETYSSIIQNNSTIKDSAIVLDLIFYSLLSSSRSKLYEAIKGLTDDWANKTTELALVPEENIFCLYMSKLYVSGVDIYSNFNSVEEYLDELKKLQQLGKIRDDLFEALNYIGKYLILYGKGARGTESNLISLVENFEKSEHPYIIAGKFNIQLKLYDYNKKTNGGYLPLDDHVKLLIKTTHDTQYSKFNIGYYNLLLARYFNITGEFSQAVKYIDLSLKNTDSECKSNVKRISDIVKLREEIFKNQSWINEVKKITFRFSELENLKREVYTLIGLLISAVTIPLSIIAIANNTEPNIRDWTFALLLGSTIILGIWVSTFFVLNAAYNFKYQFELLNFKKIYKVGKRGRY